MKKEIEILDYLTKAWNKFLKLKRQHPDEERDFADGIHKCQYLIGMRFARDYAPDIFPIKIGELICSNCLRKVPNKHHFKKGGCKWCQN
jgi:hypothetical protein